MGKLFQKSKSAGTSLLARHKRDLSPKHDARQSAKQSGQEDPSDCSCGGVEPALTGKEMTHTEEQQDHNNPRTRRASLHRYKKPRKPSLRRSSSSPSLRRSSSSPSLRRSSSSSTTSTSLSMDGSDSTSDSSVRFGNVEILEFAPAIGDSSAIPDGPPISLSWTQTQRDVFDVERFETNRQGHRRHRSQLGMDAFARREILLASGFSREELYDAEVASQRLYVQRIATIQSDRRKHLIKSALGFRERRDYGTL